MTKLRRSATRLALVPFASLGVLAGCGPDSGDIRVAVTFFMTPPSTTGTLRAATPSSS